MIFSDEGPRQALADFTEIIRTSSPISVQEISRLMNLNVSVVLGYAYASNEAELNGSIVTYAPLPPRKLTREERKISKST